MGQLKQGTLSRRGTAKVCPAGASQPVNPAEPLGPRGESLLQRASRLDSELEKSRAELGARGEVEHIEISRLAVFGPIPENSDQLNASQIEVATQEGDLDKVSVSALISFFELLDKWDREAKHNAAEIM